MITPATVGTADRSTPGVPASTHPELHLSSDLSFPIGLASDGLPVAIQLWGSGWWDQSLRAAEWCE